VYVDAAYGVHIHDGKSHSGAYTVLGVGGPLEAKSGKQKNVTKSSTEAELVALSDHAGRGINLRNFLAGQGYGVVPPGQPELHGDNGERRPNIGEITAHQHPILLALRENIVRRGDTGAQSDSAHVC
jgi:hypothetical protein